MWIFEFDAVQTLCELGIQPSLEVAPTTMATFSYRVGSRSRWARRVPSFFVVARRARTCTVSRYNHSAGNAAKYVPPDGFFGIQNFTKFHFGRGFATDRAGGAYDSPPYPLVGWDGIPTSHTPPNSTLLAPRCQRTWR